MAAPASMPDVGAHDAFPADVRGMNFYVLMDAFYRRYGEPDRGAVPCAQSLHRSGAVQIRRQHCLSGKRPDIAT